MALAGEWEAVGWDPRQRNHPGLASMVALRDSQLGKIRQSLVNPSQIAGRGQEGRSIGLGLGEGRRGVDLI